jgi:hypothetical protein
VVDQIDPLVERQPVQLPAFQGENQRGVVADRLHHEHQVGRVVPASALAVLLEGGGLVRVGAEGTRTATGKLMTKPFAELMAPLDWTAGKLMMNLVADQIDPPPGTAEKVLCRT